MDPIIYRSTDGSAPVLNRSIGALVTLLDAVLVNGYGSQSPLGWAISFTATNERSYRPPAGTRMYLAVTDDTTESAKVRGFETMTAAGVAVANGTGPYPTAAQLTNGAFAQKSNTSATDRAWIVIGDDKGFYLGVDVNGAGAWNWWGFCDIVSYKSGDAYNNILIAKGSAVTDSSADQFGVVAQQVNSSAVPGHYMPRSHAQTGSSIAITKFSDYSRFPSLGSGFGGVFAYPDPISGQLQLARMFVGESTAPRGYLRGIWCVCHTFSGMTGVANGDAFSGSDALNAMTFEIRQNTHTNGAGAIAIETTAADWT